MAGEIGLILQLVLELLPMLSKDELAKLAEEIEKKKKKNDETLSRLKKALAEGDISAINIILGELFGGL